MNLLEREDYLMGFRPENFLPKEAVGTGDNLVTLPFRVGRVEYLGSDRYIYGFVRGLSEDTKIISRLPSTVTAPIRAGQTYEFAIQDSDLRFFDKTSGERTEQRPV